jgi:hypothetical protein
LTSSKPDGPRGRTFRHWSVAASGTSAVPVVVPLLPAAWSSTGGCQGGDQTNGLEEKPAAEVQQNAVAALRDAKNVPVPGTTTDHSQGEPTQLDLRLQDHISSGMVSLNGANFEITTAGEDFYLKGDQSV